jgi:hypothetical protein
MQNIKYLIVSAEVRYWEDATVNGIEDKNGDLIPCRADKLWLPIIELDTGRIINWEQGKEADINYKICDQGEYWLADENQNKVLKYKGNYVPDEFLCIGGGGYGDYAIMKVDKDGKILNWKCPSWDKEDWKIL